MKSPSGKCTITALRRSTKNLKDKDTIMLNIKVLGSGCANCKRLETITKQAVSKLGVEAEVIKVTEYPEIMKYNILSTPGLVVNEKVVCAGRVPNEAEVTTYLTTALLENV
jgi:small redox-active disulfide protein 2